VFKGIGVLVPDDFLRYNQQSHRISWRKEINTTELLFDLDGTLWSPLRLSQAAWKNAGALHHVSTDHISQPLLASLMGHDLETFSRGVFPELEKGTRSAIAEEAMRQELMLLPDGYGEIYEGAAELLNTLCRDYRLFIISNCQHGYIQGFLDYYRLNSCITDHVSMEETGRPKRENIALIMERNGIQKGLYVGDTQSDCDAAWANGLTAVYASYGFGHAEYYNIEIKKITELTEILSG
jgi:phosphoglycolate phosphatase